MWVIDKEKIIQIFSEWSFWFRSRETGINRKEYVDKAARIIKCSEIGIVSGVRRSGNRLFFCRLLKGDEDGEEVVDGKKVKIVALWKWLLLG